MGTDASTTTPTTTSLFSSLPASLDLYADDHPFTALEPLLRQIHSNLEVLRFYASYNLTTDPDPVDVHITEALKSAVDMAALACEHIDNLESRLHSVWTQFRAIAHDEEVRS